MYYFFGSEGDQNMPSPNILIWHYFELKEVEK